MMSNLPDVRVTIDGVEYIVEFKAASSEAGAGSLTLQPLGQQRQDAGGSGNRPDKPDADREWTSCRSNDPASEGAEEYTTDTKVGFSDE
jgi:hypothetical protein